MLTKYPLVFTERSVTMAPIEESRQLALIQTRLLNSANSRRFKCWLKPRIQATLQTGSGEYSHSFCCIRLRCSHSGLGFKIHTLSHLDIQQVIGFCNYAIWIEDGFSDLQIDEVLILSPVLCTCHCNSSVRSVFSILSSQFDFCIYTFFTDF